MADREAGEEVAAELCSGLAVYSCTARAGGNKRNLLSLGERRGIASVARVSERAGGESGEGGPARPPQSAVTTDMEINPGRIGMEKRDRECGVRAPGG